jgi:hypothetical protein
VNINAKLLALFIEVTAFEAEGFRGVRHMVSMPLQLFKNRPALEMRGSLCERSRCRG